MLADRRHPLRFTVWMLVALWVTATIAAGGTYLIVKATESGEGSYRGRKYTERSRCAHPPRRESLVSIRGFTAVFAGEAALVAHTARVRSPALIYVWQGADRCVAEWALDDSG